MKSDLRQLYQEVILDHGRRPRNLGKIDGATHEADGHNPLCGDQIRVYAVVDDDRTIRDVKFEGQGCAISMAAASLMSERVRHERMTVDEFEALFAQVHGAVTGESEGDDAELGKLAVFSGVSEFPMRVKCATLAWHTLQAALDRRGEAASTEAPM